MTARTNEVDREWLSLLDTDGPFLSRPALKSFYPAGLPKPDSSVDDVNATFTEEFVRWSTEWSARPDRYNAARDRWVGVVLRNLLDWSDNLELSPHGLQAASPNGAVSVSPWAVLRRAGSAPAALVTVVDRTKDLRTIGTDGWAANTIDRMAVLLRASGTTIGVVTDGRWWALVSAANEVTTASGVWDALLWREERPSRDAFLALANFASLAGGQPEKRLPLLFAESVASAEQITEALGDQVRRAVELVLQSMSDTHLRALAKGDPSPLPEDGQKVYEGAVTMLMRIVFLLFAEERGLLPEHHLYRSAYAIAGIREELQREATATSAEALDHSWEAWHRLLAASNAVYGGASFEDMRMPAYGGSLFDPDRFPWLQSTDAQGRLQVRLTDRTMLAVLRAVQTIEDRAMQLSFRDLDVEQIGYVYEGLLSYSAEYVADVTIGLHGKSGYEPEISLPALESVETSSASPSDFASRLIEFLKKTQEKSASRTANQIMKAYSSADADEAADARTRLRHVLLGDDELAARLQRFHALIRNDLRGFPYVVPTNGLVMAESPERANTGTHYTPRSLAEEVVVHALEPLVYFPGPLESEDAKDWKLKSSAEILSLKVADIASGSGAFLVAAARYLARRVIEARTLESLDLRDRADQERWALREVIAHCLYGADINGMAVEMCKLSLWLISMDAGKPFSFVDDRVFHGNSLIGVTNKAQLQAQHIYPERRVARPTLLGFDISKDLESAARARRELASGPVDDADPMRSTSAKRALLAKSMEATAKLRDIANGVVAVALIEGGKAGTKLDNRYNDLTDALRAAHPSDGSHADRRQLEEILRAGLTPPVYTGGQRWQPLHWLVSAPDVMVDHGGFDAILGNPPFLGGKKISRTSGSNFRELLVHSVAGGRKGEADLVGYFVLRTDSLVRTNATLGLIVSESLTEGDGRRVTMDALLGQGWSAYRAVKRKKWPTEASVHVSQVWLSNRQSTTTRPICDGERVPYISSALESAIGSVTPPASLAENSGLSYMGVILSGRGFILNEADYLELGREDPPSLKVCQPFVSGDDVNNSALPGPNSYVINFGNCSLEEAAGASGALARVRELVKPARDKVNKKQYRERWWQFAERAPGLTAGLAGIPFALVIVLTSDTLMPIRLPSDAVFSNSLGVFLLDDFASLCFLSSSAHQLWAMRWGSSLDAASRYTPADVFETMPRPSSSNQMHELGRELDFERRKIMASRNIGLTRLYQMINSGTVQEDVDVAYLRSIHLQIDEAVMAAYGWNDVELNHGFHHYRNIEKWTVCPTARVEILDRLLQENYRRASMVADASRVVPTARKGRAESDKFEGEMF